MINECFPPSVLLQAPSMYAPLPSTVCRSVAPHKQEMPHLQSGHRGSVISRELMLFFKPFCWTFICFLFIFVSNAFNQRRHEFLRNYGRKKQQSTKKASSLECQLSCSTSTARNNIFIKGFELNCNVFIKGLCSFCFHKCHCILFLHGSLQCISLHI